MNSPLVGEDPAAIRAGFASRNDDGKDTEKTVGCYASGFGWPFVRDPCNFLPVGGTNI